jgi:2-oxoglutarate dehydrogenase E2 component (dihydrolipoamide succinyltransferase)
MSIEVKVPALPESVADATVVNWHKKVGDAVNRDEILVDLETDKVVLEVPSPGDGVIAEILQSDGATVTAEDVLAKIKLGGVVKASSTETKKQVQEKKQVATPVIQKVAAANPDVSPAVRRLLKENNLDPSRITGTGKEGRISKEDVQAFLAEIKKSPAVNTGLESASSTSNREEKRVPMSRLRTRVAERLLEAQHNSAMLTTFNEVNLKAVMDLRSEYKTKFEKRHGVRLGFMSFFTKAVVESLKRFPQVNASIDGNDIVYHGYFDIGIAVSTERGLVVPVLKDVDSMNMAGVEKAITDYALRAREGKLKLEEMQGGTFTITNGGVFGSLLATPILNPPQTGILGMHKIEDRPVVENGEIVIRPMMYIALSYDHRLIDGKESVQFLVSVKELLEDPSRILLDI